jgi:hypothetical protein
VRSRPPLLELEQPSSQIRGINASSAKLARSRGVNMISPFFRRIKCVQIDVAEGPPCQRNNPDTETDSAYQLEEDSRRLSHKKA